jgi:hypothetical protein
MFIVVGTVAYLAPRLSFVPRELWGRWVTDAPRYANRHLDINESVMAFGQGGIEIRVMTIERVEKKAAAGGDRYTLWYRDQHGDRQQLHLQYAAGGGGQIQIASQKGIVWRRDMPDDGS